MKRLSIIIVLLLLTSVFVNAAKTEDYNLKFGESLELEVKAGNSFKVRAREQAQIDLTVKAKEGTGSGNVKVIIDNIAVDKITTRISVNGDKFETKEISTNNNLRGTDNHYKVDLYGGRAPELFFRPEVLRVNNPETGEPLAKEEKSVILYFNIYASNIMGQLPEKKDTTGDGNSGNPAGAVVDDNVIGENKESSSLILYVVGLIVLIGIIIGFSMFKRKKKSPEMPSGNAGISSNEIQPTEVKEEIKTESIPKTDKKISAKKTPVKRK